MCHNPFSGSSSSKCISWLLLLSIFALRGASSWKSRSTRRILDMPRVKFLENSGELPHRGIGVKLRPDGVGEVVVAAAVSVDGPEHGADHAGIAARGEQFVGCAGWRLSGNDVVQGLADDGGSGVSREEADGYLVGRHRREKLLGVAADIEAVQQQFRHGGMIVYRARLVDLAIQALQRRRIVVLHINKGKDVADGVG